MDDSNKKIRDLIPATLKRSKKSYHSELEEETLSKIEELSKGMGEIAKRANDMLKLYYQKKRLSEKFKQKGRF